MLRVLLATVIVLTAASSLAGQERYSSRIVRDSMLIPWEILWGPNDSLWVTERRGYVSIMNPETGEKKVILDRQDIMYNVIEGGMVGIALHPDFPDTPYVYTGYIAELEPGVRTKYYMRFRYDGRELVDSTIFIKQDSVTAWHQGGRMIIGPDRKLYITNGERPHSEEVHDPMSIVGKTLRLNLDGSIPDDNPVPGSYMWSSGHRNHQGICFLPDGKLASSEHGPTWDDEVNIIKKGANYGWPYVVGPADEPDEIAYKDTSGAIDPIWSTGESTYALCGMKYYHSDRYPDLKNSLLVVSLKSSRVTQLKLNDTYDSVVAVRDLFEYRFGRLRDVCVSPDGRLFIGTSNQDGGQKPDLMRGYYDAIIEMIPITDTTLVGEPSAESDTTVLECRLGDEGRYPVYIHNTGTAPLRVRASWCATTSGVMAGASTLQPFEVEPGERFRGDVYYRAKSEGPHYDQMVFALEDGSRFTVPLKGITDIGYIEKVVDTVWTEVQINTPTTVNIPVKNGGARPITINSMTASGWYEAEVTADDDLEVVIQPDATEGVPVVANARTLGEHSVILTTVSTAYKQESIVLIYVSKTTVSVNNETGQSPLTLSAYPNPVKNTLNIEVEGMTGRGSVMLVNVSGEVVYQSLLYDAAENRTVTLNNLRQHNAPGLYMIRLTHSGGTLSMPIVLE